ncbi:MAG: hypothetical protein AAF797_02515 [Planctomycetota bacterium]
MRIALLGLVSILVLSGCATSPSPLPHEAAITFINKRDHPIKQATLSYRRGLGGLSGALSGRVSVSVTDLKPGQTIRVIPDSPAKGVVRLWLDWSQLGDDEFTYRQLSARCIFPDEGAMPAITFWPNDEITLIEGAVPRDWGPKLPTTTSNSARVEDWKLLNPKRDR